MLLIFYALHPSKNQLKSSTIPIPPILYDENITNFLEQKHLSLEVEAVCFVITRKSKF